VLQLPTSYPAIDPSYWRQNEEYNDALRVINCLVKVTNEAAERGVALLKQFHDKFSHDEDQKQGISLMVSHYRNKFPNANLNLPS